MHKPYLVEVVVQTTHQFKIDAHYGEEAESIAEGWLEDDEEGIIVGREVISTSSVPAEEAEMEATAPSLGEDEFAEAA